MRTQYCMGSKNSYLKDKKAGKRLEIFYAANPDEFMDNLYKHTQFSWLCDDVSSLKKRLKEQFANRVKGTTLTTNKQFMHWLINQKLVCKPEGGIQQ